MRDLEVLHDFPLMTQDDSPGSPAVDGCDPSVEILNDALVEECRYIGRGGPAEVASIDIIGHIQV